MFLILINTIITSCQNLTLTGNTCIDMVLTFKIKLKYFTMMILVIFIVVIVETLIISEKLLKPTIFTDNFFNEFLHNKFDLCVISHFNYYWFLQTCTNYFLLFISCIFCLHVYKQYFNVPRFCVLYLLLFISCIFCLHVY
jgi:hypothetical protein